MFQLVYVGLIHYCNMSALNYFVKSTIATVCALVVVLLLSPFVCDTLYQEDSSQPLTGFQQVGPPSHFYKVCFFLGRKSFTFLGSKQYPIRKDIIGKGLVEGFFLKFRPLHKTCHASKTPCLL